MEFLDKLVLPQSSEHIQLLHYMLMLIFFLFVPFISVVFGGAVLSFYYKTRGINESNPVFIRFSKDLIESLTINKSIGIIIGIVPVLTAVLIFAQLLHTTGSATVGFLIAAFVLNSIGIIFIYTYRYSYSIHEVFEVLKDYNPNEDIHNEIKMYREHTARLRNKSVIYGLVFLFLGLWLFVSGVTIASYPDKWITENIFYSLFSWIVLSRFIHFLAAAFAITGAAILFAFFYWEGGRQNIDELYKDFVKTAALRITFIAALFQPLFLLINIIALPETALSGAVFGFAAIALFLLFIAYHFLYAMIREATIRFSGHVFFALLFALMAVIIQDQLAMSNATRPQSAVLAADFEKYVTELRGEGTEIEVSGEDIFQTRCSSCHRFDTKLVGPSYNETLQKYEGKMNDLVGFILNPGKIDPAYPPMPNPGLKPNEARAVAEYIMETYKK
ncbi:MAG: c-type cytochrome [Ignavibacteriaceae bacterium]